MTSLLPGSHPPDVPASEPDDAPPSPPTPQGDDPELPRPVVPPAPRRPRFHENLALLIFLALLLTMVALALVPDPTASSRGGMDQELELRVQSRYLIGTKKLLDLAAPGDTTHRAQLLESAKILELPASHAPCTALLLRELGDEPGAKAALEGQEETTRDLREALAALLEQPPAVPAAAAGSLVRERCGFLGELALARTTEPKDDEEALLRGAYFFAIALLAAMAAGLLFVLAGCALAFFALLRFRAGQVQSAYAHSLARLPADARMAAGRTPFLEIGSLFLGGLFLLGLIASLFAPDSLLLPMLVNWLILPIFLWPALRGVPRSEIRLALGWHRGRGLWREIGAGLVGYLSAVPLLLFGLLLTVAISQWTEQPPYHPIVEWIRESSLGGLALAFSLAVIWAPLCEESVFRGALFHYLRGRLGALGAGLGVALVFAAIHPQGLAGIPFLAALAVALALAREWRGSLIASVTMHLIHNLAVFVFMILVVR